MLSAIVGRETTESLDRSNAVAIEVQSASYRTMHGYTIAAPLCDEAIDLTDGCPAIARFTRCVPWVLSFPNIVSWG